MVLDAHANELAARTLGGADPLAGVEARGVEHGCIKVGIGPVGTLEGGESEMNKHAESQVDKFLLQLMQALSLSMKHQWRYGQ